MSHIPVDCEKKITQAFIFLRNVNLTQFWLGTMSAKAYQMKSCYWILSFDAKTCTFINSERKDLKMKMICKGLNYVNLLPNFHLEIKKYLLFFVSKNRFYNEYDKFKWRCQLFYQYISFIQILTLSEANNCW